MVAMKSLLLLAVLVGPLAKALEETTLLESPQDSWGCAGQRVDFTCSISTQYYDNIVWFLNGTTEPLGQPTLPYQAVDEEISWVNGVLTRRLTLDASAVTNNTWIVCRATRSNSDDREDSQIVYLKVQGILSAPGVSYVNDSRSVDMTLVKPYCTVSHYGYTAQIPGLNFTSSSNFTEPYFSFVFSEHTAINRCEDQYITFSVCAYNLAGEGEFTNVTVLIPADPEYCVATETPPSSSFPLYSIAAALIAASVILCVVSVVLCVAIGKSRAKKCNSVSVESSPKHMALNDAYAGTYPMARNAAYEPVKEPPHIYEDIDIEPKYETIEDAKKGKKAYSDIQDA